MPNIYLRLPRYVCAFYRNRDMKHHLEPQEPIQFCEFSQEYVVVSMGARIVSEDIMKRCSCYSQFAWSNMMHGRRIGGGTRIMKRDKDEWLSPSEVLMLSGERKRSANDSYDYLCIALPREIIMGGVFYRTNVSYGLDNSSAQQLIRLLTHEFEMCILDWLVQDRRFCNQRGINRTRVESMERFLMTYDIPVSEDNKERESLRRMVNRWLKHAKLMDNDRIRFDDDFFRHVTEEEMVQINDGLLTKRQGK